LSQFFDTGEDDEMGERPVHSAGGGIAVVTTERGLPVRLRIETRELSRDSQDLAREILLLCRVSAVRQQATRRRALLDRGFGSSVVDHLRLADDAMLEEAEAAVNSDGPPLTWRRLS
jgi:hypothetical protein